MDDITEEIMITEIESFMFLIRHSKLQSWQKDLLCSFMEAQKEPMRLVSYGRQLGKAKSKNEYIKLIGQLMEELQEQSYEGS